MTELLPIACSETWSGNQATRAAFVLPGLSGWVSIVPYEGSVAGGDVLFISSCGTGRITRVLLADIAGHGSHVADLAAEFLRLMQLYLNHIAPQRLAIQMNHDMEGLSAESGRFATALVITYFAPDGGLSICNAGHPPALIYRVATGRWAAIDQPNTDNEIANLPLGVLSSSGYVGRELTLEAGDLVLCYTDGFIEATHGQTGAQLGLAGLIQAAQDIPADRGVDRPSELIGSLNAAIADAGYVYDDDLTAVVLKCTGHSGGVPWDERIRGVWRSVSAPLRGCPSPGPEWSWVNLGGVLFPGLRRRKRK